MPRRNRPIGHWLALTALAVAGGCERESPKPPPAAATLSERRPILQRPLAAREALLARSKSLELDTPYVPPPGDPLEHYAAAFAKTICSALFISGFSPEFAVENLGFVTCPSEQRAKLGQPVVDPAARAVNVRSPSGVTRTARYLDGQGCVVSAIGQSSVRFTPVVVKSRLPEASQQS